MQPEEFESTPLVEAPVLVEPVPEREPFWGYLDLALVLGLLIASVLVIGVIAAGIMYAFPSLRSNPTPLLIPTNLLVYVALYLSLRVALTFRYDRPVFQSLGWRRSGPNALILIFGGIVLAFAISLAGQLLHTPKVPTPFDQFATSKFNMALFAITAIAIAPVFEELLFRGFIQPLFSRTFGVVTGVLLTAALFGSLHLAEYGWVWQYALFVSLAGAVFGFLRARTNSIIPSTVMHGAFNAVSVVALALGKNNF